MTEQAPKTPTALAEPEGLMGTRSPQRATGSSSGSASVGTLSRWDILKAFDEANGSEKEAA